MYKCIICDYAYEIMQNGNMKGMIALKEATSVLLDVAVDSLRTGFIMTDKEGIVQYVNQKGEELLQLTESEILGMSIFETVPALRNKFSVQEPQFFKSVNYRDRKLFFNFSPQYLDGELVGNTYLFNEEQYYEVFLKKLDSYKNLNHDLKAIFDISYDVIYVSDENGVTLRVSSACEELWGKKQEELIGKSVYELETMGIYNPSVTRIVLEKKETVSLIQSTRTGRRLMVVGTPIKDENGKIIRVVNASRDITEIDRLQSKLDETRQLMEGYKKELEQLKSKSVARNQIIYQSIEMEKVIALAYRVKDVDSTVLISGETGVGKEVIANYIHQSSYRADKPFISINCGAIPENLLESELFGYEKGAFTGAVSQKLGLFELANEGTLFLDEIGEMPLNLQTKLLRVLQEQTFVRVGGTKKIEVNFRLIAATNRNLHEEMKKGSFREDLYYRLNVIPIHIPPLRERKNDILSLIQYFVRYFNEKYHVSKTISSQALDALQKYDWPGNIRELKNIIERLVVLTDHDKIGVNDLDSSIFSTTSKPRKMIESKSVTDDVVVHDIIPLKDCIEKAERQLLELAKEKYGSTTEMAKALQVNQSTVSRKLKKLGIE